MLKRLWNKLHGVTTIPVAPPCAPYQAPDWTAKETLFSPGVVYIAGPVKPEYLTSIGMMYDVRYSSPKGREP